jgi:hypothetical protein
MQKLDLLLEDLDDLIIHMRDQNEYDIKKVYLAVTKKIFDMNGTLFFGANKSLINSLLTQFGRQSLLYSLIVEDPSKINSLMEDSHLHQNWEYCCVIRDFKELSVF